VPGVQLVIQNLQVDMYGYVVGQAETWFLVLSD
jgi:hypothetical protein